jgi:proline iminopeptidase
VSVDGELVRIDDTSLFVVERGTGYPVIVLHGGPGLDHHEFADYLDPLTDEFRLLLVDQRANGRSERPPESTWTLERTSWRRSRPTSTRSSRWSCASR